MKSLRSEERGIAQIAIVVVALVVVAAIAFVGLKVLKKNAPGSSANNTVVANKEVEAECRKVYNDDDFCKFASRFTGKSYKAVYTSTLGDRTSVMTMETDGNENSSIVTKEGNQESAFIYLDGETYTKDALSGEWTKYPKSATETDTKPTDSFDFDVKEEGAKPEAERVVYKKIGKEKCGNLDCFKYQLIDPAEPTSETFLFFDDKDFLLRKWTGKDETGSAVAEFSYEKVTITAPSPVKELKTLPSNPSEAEIQNYINSLPATDLPANEE